MRRWYKNLSKKRWNNFTKQQQVLMIAAELLRAKDWLERKDKEMSKICFERALELIDLSVGSSNWHLKRRDLLTLREVIGYMYLEQAHPVLCSFLYNWLIDFSNRV